MVLLRVYPPFWRSFWPIGYLKCTFPALAATTPQRMRLNEHGWISSWMSFVCFTWSLVPILLQSHLKDVDPLYILVAFVAWIMKDLALLIM